MQNKVRFFLILGMSVFALSFFVMPASAWQINEYALPGGFGMGGDNDTVVWFEIQNDHPTDAIVGFGVGIPDEIDPYTMIWEASPPWDFTWYAETMTEEKWGWDGWYSLPDADMTPADYFGMTWEEAFGNYNSAYVAWSNYDDPSPGSIDAGTTFSDSIFDTGEEFYYIFGDEGEPASPVIVLLEGNDSFTGETGTPNAFPGTQIPEPSILFLIGIGLAGIVGTRYKLK